MSNDRLVEHVVSLVKACGQDLIDNAEEIVGARTKLKKLTINITIPLGSEFSFPEIIVNSEGMISPDNLLDALIERKD